VNAPRHSVDQKVFVLGDITRGKSDLLHPAGHDESYETHLNYIGMPVSKRQIEYDGAAPDASSRVVLTYLLWELSGNR